jgi:hypothetical protein
MEIESCQLFCSFAWDLERFIEAQPIEEINSVPYISDHKLIAQFKESFIQMILK